MSSTNPELGSRVTELRTLHPRLLFWIRLLLALLTFVALVLTLHVVAGLLLIALIVLLLLPFETPETEVAAAAPPPHLPLIEQVTRELSSSLSIGQVANVLLKAALRATHAEIATLALPVEVDHFMTIQLQQGQENVEIIQRSHTGESLIEQVLQNGQTAFNRDRTALAVVLRHEYLVVGALSVEAPQQIFTQAEADLLSEVAVPAAISLHNAHLLDEQQYQIETLSHNQALTLRLAGAVDSNAVIEAVLETTRDVLGVQEVALYRTKESGVEALVSLHRDRFSRLSYEKRLTITIAVKAAETGQIEATSQPVTCIAIPIERRGTVKEVIAVAFIENHVLRHRDLHTLGLIAIQTAAHLNTVELHEQVRAVSERLRVTINSARDGVLLFDSEGKLIECNPSAERLLGIDKETFIGKHFVAMLFDMMDSNEMNGLGYSRGQLTELARQLRLEPNSITRRQFEQTNEGQMLFIEEIGSPVIDADNKIVGRLLVLRDMTEQKQLADFRDEITHMAVHDLRGPLTAIINGIDMTLRLGLSEYPDDSERVLRLSLSSAQSLMRLINSLLDIAKLESRRMPINAQPVPAAQLVENARSALETSIDEAHIQVEIALAEDLPTLHVDEDLIRRVLINLIDNAIRFTPEGAVVRIASQPVVDQRVILSVADSGKGIPPEERDQIFEQYRQSEQNQPLRGSKGTGLGLTFCKLAVEAHGGRIWVEGAETLPGACFLISLPVES
ncbi:MAG: PAS domain S-box protein [Chloroflexi bacterium]|nr:PAS domain S-box protein [Chloroflexota bacterium]